MQRLALRQKDGADEARHVGHRRRVWPIARLVNMVELLCARQRLGVLALAGQMPRHLIPDLERPRVLEPKNIVKGLGVRVTTG